MTDLGGAFGRLLGGSQLVQALGIDGYGIRPGQHVAALSGRNPIPKCLQTQPLPDEPDEVMGAARQLKADQIRAQKSFQNLMSPRKLHEELRRWKWDVEEKTDSQVGSLAAQQLRNQLQVVVLYPNHCALGRHLRRAFSEPPIDCDVGVPPFAVELGRCDGVVI